MGEQPAGSNFGDCVSDALAREEREPTLFKGEDFSKTDLRAAV
jgi:ribonuclease VapC